MRPSDRVRLVALAAHGLLILGVALRDPSALSAVMVLILCLPLPGLWRARIYTYAWSSMLIAFFVAGYLADGYARPATRGAAFAMASIAALDFVAVMMFVRISAREEAAAAARAPAPAERTEASPGASR
ncbi:MAG: DUF2069 domain-containing protein [Panacagrimonas sp.]